MEVLIKDVKNVIYNYTKKDISIDENTCLTGKDKESLDLDSMEIVKLVVDLENEFDIIIDFDVKFETVGDIVNYINNYTESI